MSSTTTKLGLIMPATNEYPDIEEAVNENMEKLDSEVWNRGKSFNGATVGEDGGFHVNYIPYAGNLETSSGQKSEEEYIIRTSGGEASISDGDAWLLILRGRMRHDNFIPQSIDMTVIPMERTADPDITATLNAETFEAYVEEAGTYTLTYTTEWSATPSDYGLTISNTPIAGDTIIITWDGENEPELTVNAATRPEPESISATMDESVFVSYVTQSGTTTLTYSTAWSADPANYGITVTGTPVAGDVITVVYVKEVRGTIVQSNPQTFVSTGWNLYNHALGYARVIKYSPESGYGFKISGTYTALEFSTTTTGTRTTITPVSGYFTIPDNGYLFVTGGNDTDTQIWMTWSDWTSTANGGVFEAYTQDVVDLTTFMASTFPYGLMAVGTARDEINLNIGLATSNVARMAYNETNLENAKASGLQYEYDENYIYIERSAPVTYTVEVDGDYVASDHGMEYFTGSDQAVYAENLYGANLKNKLERDVLQISQQALTSDQQAQVRLNLGVPSQTEVDTLNNKITPSATYTSDLNNAPSGVVYTSTGVSNTPANYDYWFVFTEYYTGNNTVGAQIAIGRTGTNPPMYFRAKSGGSWTEWKELALNTNTSCKRGGIGPSILSDTYIMGLSPGVYSVNVDNASVTNGYVPKKWGTLTISQSGDSYNSCIFVSTSNQTYFRIYNSTNSTWYDSWKELALNESLSSRAKISSYSLEANSTVYFNHTGTVLLFTDRGGMWTEGSAGRSLTEISAYGAIAVTRSSNTKIKIVSSAAYSTLIVAIGFGETFNFSTT